MYYDTTNPDSDALRNARLYSPRLFFISEYTWTGTFIMILGYLNLGFSLLVITFFAIKKAPLLITDMWISFLKTEMRWF
jgi:inositol 1,4,5-triphosphate receptor type 3